MGAIFSVEAEQRIKQLAGGSVEDRDYFGVLFDLVQAVNVLLDAAGPSVQALANIRCRNSPAVLRNNAVWLP